MDAFVLVLLYCDVIEAIDLPMFCFVFFFLSLFPPRSILRLFDPPVCLRRAATIYILNTGEVHINSHIRDLQAVLTTFRYLTHTRETATSNKHIQTFLNPKALHSFRVVGDSLTNLSTRGAAAATNEDGKCSSVRRRKLKPLARAIRNILIRSIASVLALLLNLTSPESVCCSHAWSFKRNTSANGAHGFPGSGYSMEEIGIDGMFMTPGKRRSTLHLP
jgi:hypothetical protein